MVASPTPTCGYAGVPLHRQLMIFVHRW